MTNPLLLHGWQDFYLLSGTAAASLIGLVFVAISLGARLAPNQAATGVRAFVTPTVIHFGAVLVVSAVTLIPTYTAQSLGASLALAGLVGVGYSLNVT